MSQAFTNEQFQQFVRIAEDRERARLGENLPIARQALARRWKISAGTLFNVRRGRFKDLRHSVLQAIGRGLLSDINNEIARLEHEREILIRSGLGADDCQVSKADDAVAKLKAAYASLTM